MRRSAALVGTIALTFGLLAGCGSDDKAEPLSQQQLESSLLTASDLGAGWQEAPSGGSDDGDDSGAPSCLQDAGSSDDGEESPEAQAAFGQGESTALFETITSKGEDAGAAFDKAKGQLDDCQDMTMTINGKKVSGSITAIDDFPEAGDQSAGYTMTLTDGDDSLDFALAIVRKGGADMLLLYGGLNTPDQAQFSEYVTTAADKVGTPEAA